MIANLVETRQSNELQRLQMERQFAPRVSINIEKVTHNQDSLNIPIKIRNQGVSDAIDIHTNWEIVSPLDSLPLRLTKDRPDIAALGSSRDLAKLNDPLRKYLHGFKIKYELVFTWSDTDSTIAIVKYGRVSYDSTLREFLNRTITEQDYLEKAR